MAIKAQTKQAELIEHLVLGGMIQHKSGVYYYKFNDGLCRNNDFLNNSGERYEDIILYPEEYEVSDEVPSDKPWENGRKST